MNSGKNEIILALRAIDTTGKRKEEGKCDACDLYTVDFNQTHGGYPLTSVCSGFLGLRNGR